MGYCLGRRLSFKLMPLVGTDTGHRLGDINVGVASLGGLITRMSLAPVTES